MPSVYPISQGSDGCSVRTDDATEKVLLVVRSGPSSVIKKTLAIACMTICPALALQNLTLELRYKNHAWLFGNVVLELTR